MAQILVRNLDDDLVKGLKRQAEASGRSLQAEAKRILERGVRLSPDEAKLLSTTIREELGGNSKHDSHTMLREIRGH